MRARVDAGLAGADAGARGGRAAAASGAGRVGHTEAYTRRGNAGAGAVRTANPQRWFCKGCRYVAPYADFRMTVLDRVQLTDGNWAWIGQITQSGGTPQRGTILSYPLYGDRGLWLTEDEFNAAVQANGGR